MSFLNLLKKKIDEPKPETKKLAVHPHTNSPRRIGVGVKEPAAPAVPPSAPGGAISPNVLIRPHISERASDASAKGVYVFKVAPQATKREIARAIAGLYNVTVEKVRTVTVHSKKVIVRGKPGIRGGGKKAYVYLKAREKIEVL